MFWEITEIEDTLFFPIYDYSYIQESVYYPVLIKDIQKIKNGYVVFCLVNVDKHLRPVWFVVGSNDLIYNGKRLHPRMYCMLSFKKYHHVPLGYGPLQPEYWIGDYYEEILDVLAGNSILNVKETDYTKCFLVSLDLGKNDKRWIDSVAFHKEKLFDQMQDSILSTLNRFLYAFSFSNIWSDYINILQMSDMQKCFEQWSHRSQFRDFNKRNLKQAYSKRKFRWQCIADCCARLSLCQQMSGLPAIFDTNNVEINNVKLLYMSGDVITLRVRWTINRSIPKNIVLTLSSKACSGLSPCVSNKQWKVSGIARESWHYE